MFCTVMVSIVMLNANNQSVFMLSVFMVSVIMRKFVQNVLLLYWFLINLNYVEIYLCCASAGLLCCVS